MIHSTCFIYGYTVVSNVVKVSICTGTTQICVFIYSVAGRKEMFYLTTHSKHFIYGYMASDMVKDHSDSEKGNPLPPYRPLFRLTARVLLYAPSHRQDSTYHGLCYTSREALAGTRNISVGSPHEGSI